MVDTLETKAVEVLDKITNAIEAAATPAAEAALTAVWFEGLTGLIRGACYVGVAVIAGYATHRLSKPITDEWKKGFEGEPVISIFGGFGVFGGAGITVGFFVSALDRLTSAYNWAAIINPPAALALRIINSL